MLGLTLNQVSESGRWCSFSNHTKVLVWFSSREVSVAMHEMRDDIHMSDRTLRKVITLYKLRGK